MAIRQEVPRGCGRFDIGVIGSGPAGLAVALGAAGLYRRLGADDATADAELGAIADFLAK